MVNTLIARFAQILVFLLRNLLLMLDLATSTAYSFAGKNYTDIQSKKWKTKNSEKSFDYWVKFTRLFSAFEIVPLIASEHA